MILLRNTKLCCQNVLQLHFDIRFAEAIYFHKVWHKIFRKRKGFDIWIKAKMDPAKGSAPQLMEKVAEIVRNEMKNIFGVENIRDVKLVISGCSADSDPEDDSEDIFKDDDREEQIISLKNTPENDKKDE